ncbi:hypothetical protein B0J14DRAFT_650044 [Halenospora varia]|nr:hypothetical protein B0J14DRAFT_650044 [Halenospora varia]
MDRMMNRYDAVLSAHLFERLVIDLLTRADRFEEFLSHEHTEDKPTDKQISIIDEEWYCTYPPSGLRQGFTFEDLVTWMQVGSQVLDCKRYMEKIEGDIGFLNLQRRNFRLLRDWTGGRPWEKIY